MLGASGKRGPRPHVADKPECDKPRPDVIGQVHDV